MDSATVGSGQGGEGEKSSDLVIGFIGTPTNSAPLIREIIRAQQRGYDVLVTHYGSKTIESVQLAAELGVTIVDPEAAEPDEAYLRNTLTEVAQTIGYRGVIFAGDGTDRVNFQRSERLRGDDEFLTEAVSEPEASLPPSPELLIAIPAFNEAATIEEVVADARTVTDAVIVVDDDSDDNTAALARDAGATIIKHDRNQGYGAALQTAFEVADRHGAQQLAILDGDGQHDPTDIPKLTATQERMDADLVIGSRFTDDGDTNAPYYRRFGLAVVNVLTNLSLGVIRQQSWIHDTQSGFRLYDRPLIESLARADGIGDHMSASTDILYHAHHNNFSIAEAGTDVDYTIENASTLNPVTHGITLVMNILRTVEQDRPVTILGVPGFVSTLVGIGFGYWTFANYITSGVFPLGLAITSVFFTLMGIFASFTAIILHSLNTHLANHD